MAYPQVTFSASTIQPQSLIGRRRRAVVANTLRYQLDVLKKTGRYDAFKLQWHPTYDRPPLVWPIPDHLFWDSDVAKWIEGACYFLKEQELPEIAAAVDELVDMIRSAQQPDGYLNIHYTVVAPGKRFTNLKDMHELYNLGHLIEAALAHHDLYNNMLLMDPIIKYVDLLCARFGPEEHQVHGYPGHPEIELALLRLYERTSEPRFLSLARYFITERGSPNGMQGMHYFDWEAKERGDDPSRRPAFYPEPRCLWYHQAQAPISQQTTIEGHAVRAMYLLTAVADLVRIEGPDRSPELTNALHRLWRNMVDRKMYLTGGIGSIKQWEGFGGDYFLPQGTDEGGCYSETCAAIGVMMLAQRILQIDLDGQFTDIMELCLYNAVLTAMSSDGKSFTYENQLASSDKDPSCRCDWFTVACCPPNMLRLLGQIGGYTWSEQRLKGEGKGSVATHLFIPSTYRTEIDGQVFEISQETAWPFESSVKFHVTSAKPLVDVLLRIPSWASTYQLQPSCPGAVLSKGYLRLDAEWVAANPSFTLDIPITPRFVSPNPATGQRTLTLMKGPVVYCVEDSDNDWVVDHFKNVFIDRNGRITSKHVLDEATGDEYVALSLHDSAWQAKFSLDVPGPFLEAHQQRAHMSEADPISSLNFVPYFYRANRVGKGQMRVGLQSV